MRLRSFLLAFTLPLLACSPSFALAQTTEPTAHNSSIYSPGLINAATEAYDMQVPEPDIGLTIGAFVSALLGLLGVIFFILTMYAGVLWMTAGGNTDSVKKAKQILGNAVIGLILTVTSYAITYFVIGLAS